MHSLRYQPASLSWTVGMLRCVHFHEQMRNIVKQLTQIPQVLRPALGDETQPTLAVSIASPVPLVLSILAHH